MKVGRRGVHAEVDAQRPSGFARRFEFREQLGLRDDFGNALSDMGELLFHRFERVFAHFHFRSRVMSRPDFAMTTLTRTPPRRTGQAEGGRYNLSTRRPAILYFPSRTMRTASE